MDQAEQLYNLAKLIISSNIWIGTIFWIGLGIFFVMMISMCWGYFREAKSRLAKALLLTFWALAVVEMLVVTGLIL